MTVVVTGGGKGIGQYITRAFYAQGAHVVVASREDSGFATQLGDRARFVHCDVRRPEDLHNAATLAAKWTGQLTTFVNNAGYSKWMPLGTIDENGWNDMIDTNLKGVLFGCQAAAAHMRDGGTIINLSSLASKRGTANNSVYCASKFGVNGITQALAKELGPRGIRVNAVCPVLVTTDGLVEALQQPHAPADTRDVKDFLATFAASQSALGRLPDGDEVAAVCLFLASPAASAITGQCINVDCGVLPQ